MSSQAPLNLLLLSIFLTFIVYSDQMSMKISINPEATLEGGTIEARCDVVMSTTKDFQFVVWYRRLLDGKEEEIASNDHVNFKFNRTGRYKASVSRNTTQNTTVSVHMLNISDARITDAGEIGCKIPDSLEIRKKVQVIVPATSIELVTKDHSEAVMYSDGDEATFDEDEPIYVSCKAKGSFPQANLSITSGPDTDLTRRFELQHQPMKLDDKTRNDSFFVSKAEAILPMSYELHDKNLTCAVHYANLLSPSLSVSVLIKLRKYFPKIKCPSEVSLRPYEKNFKVECKIYSYPSFVRSQVAWSKMYSKEIKYVLPINESIGIYKLTEFPNSSRLIFSIKKMFPQAFRTYKFEAWNSAGHGYHEMRIVRSVPEAIAANNQASTQSSTRFICIPLVLLFAIS